MLGPIDTSTTGGALDAFMRSAFYVLEPGIITKYLQQREGTFCFKAPPLPILSSPAAPHLLTSNASAAVGGQARLMLQWSQGGAQFNPPGKPVARTVLSAWLTLKPKSAPPVT